MSLLSQYSVLPSVSLHVYMDHNSYENQLIKVSETKRRFRTVAFSGRSGQPGVPVGAAVLGHVFEN